MPFTEEDLIMLSALQHYVFCPRQCALIHVEQVWAESGLTAEGRILHERVHEAGDESRGGVRIARGVPLRSLRLGLVGVADVGGIPPGRQEFLAALPCRVQTRQTETGPFRRHAVVRPGRVS